MFNHQHFKAFLWFFLCVLSLKSYASDVVWPKLIVHLHSSGHAYLIDPQTDTVVADLETTKGATLGSTTPNASKVYIGAAAKEERQVTVIDLDQKAVIARIETGNRPKHPLVSPDGKWVGVNHWGLDEDKLRVSFIDVATDKVVKEIALEVADIEFPGVTSMHNAWSEDSSLLFTLNRVNNQLVVINTSDWSVDTYTTESTPHYAVPSPNGKELWVTLEGKEDLNPGIAVYDLTHPDMNIITKIYMPLIGEVVKEGHHGNFTQDGLYFIMSNRGPGSNALGREVAIFDAQTKQLMRRITTATTGVGHTYNTPDGRLAIATNYGNNVLTLIDMVTMSPVKDLVIGTGRMGHIAFTKDGLYGYISSAKDGALYKLDMQRFMIVKKIVTNGNPGAGQVLNVWTNVFEELPRMK